MGFINTNGCFIASLFIAVFVHYIQGDHWQVLKKLKECGFNPSQTIDIGANVGDWSRSFHNIFPQSKILMIEGNQEHRNKLQTTGFPFEIALLGSHSRNVTFYKARGTGTGSTVFRENTDEKMVPITVTTLSVDAVLAKHQVETAAMMKLDIQGSEVTKYRYVRMFCYDNRHLLYVAGCIERSWENPSFRGSHTHRSSSDELQRRSSPIFESIQLC